MGRLYGSYVVAEVVMMGSHPTDAGPGDWVGIGFFLGQSQPDSMVLVGSASDFAWVGQQWYRMF